VVLPGTVGQRVDVSEKLLNDQPARGPVQDARQECPGALKVVGGRSGRELAAESFEPREASFQLGAKLGVRRVEE
jgi:hypothetical protein